MQGTRTDVRLIIVSSPTEQTVRFSREIAMGLRVALHAVEHGVGSGSEGLSSAEQ